MQRTGRTNHYTGKAVFEVTFPDGSTDMLTTPMELSLTPEEELARAQREAEAIWANCRFGRGDDGPVSV